MIKLYNKDEHYNEVLELAINHTKDVSIAEYIDRIVDNAIVEVDSSGLVVSLLVHYEVNCNEDIIMIMNKDNRFRKTLWKALFRVIDSIDKIVYIESDGSNNALHKSANRVGGYFDEDVIVFPRKRGKFL